jgi:hypothetical protein
MKMSIAAVKQFAGSAQAEREAIANTKIELATEAIESLVLATSVATNPASSHHEQQIAVQNIALARENLADALRTLLAPTLRIA